MLQSSGLLRGPFKHRFARALPLPLPPPSRPLSLSLSFSLFRSHCAGTLYEMSVHIHVHRESLQIRVRSGTLTDQVEAPPGALRRTLKLRDCATVEARYTCVHIIYIYKLSRREPRPTGGFVQSGFLWLTARDWRKMCYSRISQNHSAAMVFILMTA